MSAPTPIKSLFSAPYYIARHCSCATTYLYRHPPLPPTTTTITLCGSFSALHLIRHPLRLLHSIPISPSLLYGHVAPRPLCTEFFSKPPSSLTSTPGPLPLRSTSSSVSISNPYVGSGAACFMATRAHLFCCVFHTTLHHDPGPCGHAM